MPCNYVIARDGAVVLELWTGTVSLTELTGHKTHLANEVDLRPGASVLSDCRRAEFEFSPEAIGDLANMENDPASDARIARYAFLVPDEVYAMARQFADKVEGFGKTVIVFNSLDVAATWLGMELSEVLALQERLLE